VAALAPRWSYLLRNNGSAIRTLIADDEEPARERLRRLLQDEHRIQIVAESSDGPQTLELIERLHPQLVFLDVQMPGLNGFEVLRGLSSGTPRPLTIFVTGFHEHALEAFQARAIAYLLKPIDEDHLNEMIDRAEKLLAPGLPRDEEDRNVEQLLADNLRPIEQIVARKANRVFLVDPADAVFFYMDNGIVRVRVENDTYWVNYHLGELEDALASRGFFRARRSSLVNLKQIREIRPDPRGSFVLVMKDARNSEVEVSERQGRALRTRIPGL
jgi:two-component system, LytTR family, response regulator